MPNDNLPTEEEFEENAKAVNEVYSGRTVKPWDLLNPTKERVDDEEKERRLSICRTCPQFRARTQRCSRCGCFMNLKTLLHEANCPDGLW